MGAYVRKKLVDQGKLVYSCGLSANEDYQLNFDYDEVYDFRKAVERVFVEGEQALDGPFDVLINNAGFTHMEFTPKHALLEVENIMKINAFAPFEFTRYFIERTQTHNVSSAHPLGHHVVVSTGSGAIDVALRSCPGYVASKGALDGFMRTWAKEFAGKSPVFSFFTVSPAMIEGTKMMDYVIERLMQTRHMSREEAIRYNQNVPMGRWCTHEDCWVAYDFAINHATNYWSGTNLRMNGGNGLR